MTRICRWTGSLILAGILAAPLAAANQQPAAAAPAPAQVPAANPADVASPDAILAAVYDAISGPQGHPRDWNRFRSLFIDGARLVEVEQTKDGSYGARVMTMDDFIAYVVPLFDKEGFYEREAARKTERWANIQQVFSTYESRHAASDVKPFVRGINSFQLLNDGKRWWVVTVFWQDESPGNPLTAKYLRTTK